MELSKLSKSYDGGLSILDKSRLRILFSLGYETYIGPI